MRECAPHAYKHEQNYSKAYVGPFKNCALLRNLCRESHPYQGEKAGTSNRDISRLLELPAPGISWSKARSAPRTNGLDSLLLRLLLLLVVVVVVVVVVVGNIAEPAVTTHGCSSPRDN